MTSQNSASLHAALDSEEQALADGLRALGDSNPTPALDARIRTQARTALRRRPLAVWGAGLAAMLALGVGLRVILAPTELAVPSVPSENAPAQAPSMRPPFASTGAEEAAVEGKAEAPETLPPKAQKQPSDATPTATSPPQTAVDPAPVTTTSSGKFAETERRAASDAPILIDADAVRENASEGGQDAANRSTSGPSQADLVLRDATSAEQPVADAAVSELARPAEPRAEAARLRPRSVEAPVAPVVPVIPMTPAAPPLPPAAAAAPSFQELPNAFPPPAKPASVPQPSARPGASSMGIQRRERQSPVHDSEPAPVEEAAKRDQEDDALSGAGAQPHADGKALDVGQRAKAGAAAQNRRATQTQSGVAAEATDRDRIQPPQRIAAEPSLMQLIQRARLAHQAGDTDALRATLRRIDRLYPDAELPADVREWLNRERAR